MNKVRIGAAVLLALTLIVFGGNVVGVLLVLNLAVLADGCGCRALFERSPA